MELAETGKISRSTQKNLNTNAVNHRNQETAIQVRQQLYYRDDAGVFFELNPPPEAVFRPHWVTEAPDASISAENGCHDYEASSPHWTKKNIVLRMQQVTMDVLRRNKTGIIRAILFLLFVGYTIYFSFALVYSVDMSIALIVLTSLTVAGLVYAYIRDHYGDAIYRNVFKPIGDFLSKHWHIIKWFLYPSLSIVVVLYLSLSVIQETKQLQSLSGFVFLTLVTYLTSRHPDRVLWRPVVWGYAMQFIMAILVLRWEYGYIAVKFISDEIVKFVQFAFEGAAVVFGDPFLILHPFVFMGMPLLIYMGAVTSVLYYWGVTQWAVCKMGWLMQVTMGTTAVESFSTAANIFLSGMDTILMLRHYLDKLTPSEYNCFHVGSHATVAGFVFALFVMFGAPPQHLLSAAVMSAPATIAICKLNYPETNQSITKDMDQIQLSKSEEVNVFEAGASGAAVAAKTVSVVVAGYIAFMSILAFVNATLSWLGGRVGYSELSFELICSYIMWPIALMIGIDLDECQEAAKLIGYKIFATEILAYQELGKSANVGKLNARDEAIVTYALCGFSSLSSIAIGIGIFRAIFPDKINASAVNMVRTFFEANISCFLTACIAGLFYSEEMIQMLETVEDSPQKAFVAWIGSIIPGYKDLMGLVGS